MIRFSLVLFSSSSLVLFGRYTFATAPCGWQHRLRVSRPFKSGLFVLAFLLIIFSIIAIFIIIRFHIVSQLQVSIEYGV